MERSNFLNRVKIFIFCIKDYLFKKNYVAKSPHTLIIEMTNHCNLSCKMCFHKIMKRKKGFLSNETMNILLNNLRNYKIPHVQFAFGGEPFLNNKILDYVKELKKIGIKVEIFTNGLLVDKDMTNKIINSGLDIINFSIDSTDKKTYTEIRKNGNLDTVIGNLKYLSKLKKQLKTRKPYIKLYVTRLKDNKIEIKNKLFKKKYLKYVDHIYYNCENNWIGSIDDELIIEKKNIGNNSRICVYPWVMMVVAYDGIVVPCPCDFDTNYQIGDVHKESLEKIWNGEKMRYLRRVMINKDYTNIDLCYKCLWRKYNPLTRLLFNRIKSEIMDLIH